MYIHTVSLIFTTHLFYTYQIISLLSGTLLVTEIKSFHIILDLFKLALTHKGKSLILIL